MKIGSLSEDKDLEKRISITPEIAKKYIDLGLEVFLDLNYGSHLGFDDSQYKDIGVKVLADQNDIISSTDLLVQLNLLNDDKLSIIKENHNYKVFELSLNKIDSLNSEYNDWFKNQFKL